MARYDVVILPPKRPRKRAVFGGRGPANAFGRSKPDNRPLRASELPVRPKRPGRAVKLGPVYIDWKVAEDRARRALARDAALRAEKGTSL